jgi:hypothetical protein
VNRVCEEFDTLVQARAEFDAEFSEGAEMILYERRLRYELWECDKNGDHVKNIDTLYNFKGDDDFKKKK